MGEHAASTVGLVVWHDHVSGDVERATAFYRDVLGWEYEVWKHAETEYPMIAVGGRRHGGFLARGGVARWLPYVRVDDVDESVRRIGEAGGRVHAPPTDLPDVGRFAVVADRQGAAFTVWRDESDEATGNDAFAWDELYTDDPAAAADFYGAMFGWSTAPFNKGYTVFKRGDAMVGGLLARPDAIAEPGWLPYLTTADADRTFARAGERGARSILEPTDIPNVGRVAVLVDPAGAAFGLWATA